MSRLRVQQTRDRLRAACPVRRLDLELLAPLARQLVVPRAPRVLRLAPFGVEPPRPLEPLERGQQRPRIDLEHAARHLLHATRDAEAVHRLEADGLEDEHVERALNDAVVRHAGTIRLSHLDCQDVTIKSSPRDRIAGMLAHFTLATRDIHRTAAFLERTLGYPRKAVPAN